jgi:hypothetical protein
VAASAWLEAGRRARIPGGAAQAVAQAGNQPLDSFVVGTIWKLIHFLNCDDAGLKAQTERARGKVCWLSAEE